MLAPPSCSRFMELRRATIADNETVASILNHPSVRPFLGDGGGDDVDPSGLIADQKSVLLFDHGGGQYFHWKGPGVFEAHSFYIVRGKAALERAVAAVRLMQTDHGANLIWRATPVENRPARWFNRQLGFTSLGLFEMGEGYGSGRCELFEMRSAQCL